MCLASSGSDMVLSDSPSLKLWVPKMCVVSERGQAGGYLENAVHTVNDDGTITRYEELQINHEHGQESYDPGNADRCIDIGLKPGHGVEVQATSLKKSL
ncbi:unnamed protein product [Fusarium graminearum]|nr:unnamed protein product [Fusarium graminearum]